MGAVRGEGPLMVQLWAVSNPGELLRPVPWPKVGEKKLTQAEGTTSELVESGITGVLFCFCGHWMVSRR